MEVEVMMPSPPADFNFDSACTTPYISAPSSPQPFGTFFYSAPTSPTRISAFYNRFHGGDTLPTARTSFSSEPFNWEEKSGTPKSHISTATSSNYGDAEENDFAFDFGGQLEKGSLPADELFDGGKIKPLKLQYDQNKPLDSPKTPKSPKNLIKEAFSPRNRKRNSDRFAAALEQTRKVTVRENAKDKNSSEAPKFRVSDILLDPEFTEEEPTNNSSSSSRKLLFSSSFSSIWYKKWKLKDLLLFRSVSESRVTDKDNSLKKYESLKKTNEGDVKNSSFRSTDGVGSSSIRRKSGAPISAHELHYTANRAVSEEMKKRTYLPYKQGLLGCLGFHPTGPPEISKGIYSSASLSRV